MIGLALSGGGFRATLFHLGSLWRLNELGLIKDIDEITSVSGGSIIAAYLGLRWNDLNFNTDKIADNFNNIIAESITDFCSRTVDISTILAGIIDPIKHPSEFLIKNYCKYLFGDATLQDLPETGENPRFTIYATSMQTGASVRFTRDYLGDYHLGKILNPEISLAAAVAASSAFPPPLCPVRIKLNPNSWQKSGISDLHEDNYLKSTMLLVDGGVYDNLGLERLVKNCDTIFVSDAGAPFSIQRKMIGTRISQLVRTKRTLDIISRQIRALRIRNLMYQYENGFKQGAYWGIGTNIDEYPLREKNLPPALANETEQTQAIATIRTRLNTFSPMEQGHLINWGYCLTDAALRSRFDPSLDNASHFPINEYPL